MSVIDSFDNFHPLKRSEWRRWLKKNYAKSRGVWFVYFKKHTGKPRVSYEHAVEEALCFGWVDSLQRKLDDDRSRLLFTPRKAKSAWSRPNKERVARMIEDGLMTEPGLAKIEAAKQDGSWNAMEASDNLEVPEDLAAAFDKDAVARKSFESFSNSAKKAILFWLSSAKRKETREARIVKIVARAAANREALSDKE